MWQPDSKAGLVVLQCPPIPKIDHPIKLVESKFKDEDDEESTDSTLGGDECKNARK
jgi:hypothetical protein